MKLSILSSIFVVLQVAHLGPCAGTNAANADEGLIANPDAKRQLHRERKWGGFHHSDSDSWACRSNEDSGSCIAEAGCRWCRRSQDDSEFDFCSSLPDGTDQPRRTLRRGGGGYRSGGCCEVASDAQTCNENGNGVYCVWLSGETQGQQIGTCETIQCHLFTSSETECENNSAALNCMWDSGGKSMCSKFDCKKLKDSAACANAGCEWDESAWWYSKCTEAESAP